VAVQLREKLLQGKDVEGEHERLVAVIAGAEVALRKAWASATCATSFRRRRCRIWPCRENLLTAMMLVSRLRWTVR